MYECEYWTCIQVEVLTKPELNDDQYTWQAKDLKTWRIIDYLVTVWMSHYAPKLYSDRAYWTIK